MELVVETEGIGTEGVGTEGVGSLRRLERHGGRGLLRVPRPVVGGVVPLWPWDGGAVVPFVLRLEKGALLRPSGEAREEEKKDCITLH